MFRLGLPKISDRFDFGHDFSGPQARRLHIRYRVQSDLPLILLHIVDRRTIAETPIIALPIGCGRIVNLKEEFQQVAIGYHRRIKDDLDPFGMRSMIAIGRIGYVPTSISDACRLDAGLLADQILHAPETATCQYCALVTHATSST